MATGEWARLVERLAPEYGFEVVGRLDDTNNIGGVGIPSAPDADVAVEFSVPSAVAENLPKLAARKMNVVIGTTGWHEHEEKMKKIAADAGIGVVAASNFSLGVALFQSLAEQAAKMFAPYPQYGAWIHEIHHSAKKDAPSGTAITLQQGMKGAGYSHNIDMASSRAGSVPGTHTVGFDGPFETITMTHTNQRSCGVRAGRAAGCEVGARAARLVYDSRCAWDFVAGDNYENTIYRRWHCDRDAVHPTLLLDEDGVRRLARRQIDEGVHFLVPCGTTGESPTLSEEERTRIVQICVEEARGKVPVLAGAGGYDTREVIHAARQMERAGANGLLSVTPYYNKPTPDGLIQHYKAIAESTSLPIIVYNVPGRTGCNVDPATLVKLAAIPNVIGVKEASGNIQQMCEICRAVPARLHRAFRRRCDYAAADGGWRPRRHLGGVERSASPDVADGRSRRARRLRGGARRFTRRCCR